MSLTPSETLKKSKTYMNSRCFLLYGFAKLILVVPRNLITIITHYNSQKINCLEANVFCHLSIFYIHCNNPWLMSKSLNIDAEPMKNTIQIDNKSNYANLIQQNVFSPIYKVLIKELKHQWLRCLNTKFDSQPEYGI